MDELKPCPFCGKKRAIILTAAEADNIYDEWYKSHYVVICSLHEGGCGASTRYDNADEEEAAKAWNRRAEND